MLNISQHSQEKPFTRVSFLINIVAACNLILSLFKKWSPHWCFPDSYLNFLTTTFLKREKKNCYKKKSIVVRNVDLCNFACISAQFIVTTKQHVIYSLISQKEKQKKSLNIQARRNKKNSWGPTNEEVLSATMVGRRRNFSF